MKAALNQPVRIGDRKTWRREPSFWESHWPHVAGPIAVSLEVYLLLARLSGTASPDSLPIPLP